jgi:hypothetical protein
MARATAPILDSTETDLLMQSRASQLSEEKDLA